MPVRVKGAVKRRRVEPEVSANVSICVSRLARTICPGSREGCDGARVESLNPANQICAIQESALSTVVVIREERDRLTGLKTCYHVCLPALRHFFHEALGAERAI